MAYGRAYVYFQPEYSMKKDDKTETQVLSSFKIVDIEGRIKKKSKIEYFFYRKGFNMEIKEIRMKKNQLVIFDIRELGFSKRYFTNISKKLSRCNIVTSSTDMITNHSDIYDYIFHSERIELAELKASRNTGWSLGTEKLSDSYFHYKKIQKDEIQIHFLEYIINRINEGLRDFLGDDAGKLVAHINRKNYKQLWKDYSEGKITGTELTKVLF